MTDRKVDRRHWLWSISLCSALLLSGCSHLSASDGCGNDAMTVDGHAVARLDCHGPLGNQTGAPTSARVGQTVKVHLPKVDAGRLQSSDPLTLVPAGSGSFRAAMPGYASVFLLAKPGERCVQPPHTCNVFNVHVVK